MQDLSVHHQSARQGTAAPGSSRGTRGYHSASAFQSKSPSESETITIQNLLELLRGSPQLLILDTRPLGSFLEHHLPRSANISIPSLIYKRFRKSTGAKVTSLDALTGFISTSAGRHIWDGLDLTRHMDVVVIGLTSSDELATVLGGIMQGLVQIGGVRVLSGGWDAVLASPAATSELVCGETSDKGPVASDSLPPPNPGYGSSVPLVSPTFSTLRPTPPGSKRNLPSLSVQGNNASSRRPPKLSLNLDKPLRSATLGSFPAEPPKQSLRKNASMLSINTGESSRAAPGLSISVPKTPMPGSSFQALCHAQSKLPPSPSSFGDVKRIHDKDEGIRGARTPITPWLDTGTARPNGGSNSHSPFVGSGLLTGGQATVRNPLTSFVVSTILPSFLYLGPEISTQEDVDELRRLGVKRILNVAIECDDDEGLGLKDAFEKYCRVPMRDIVEESGVAKGMRDSCDFLGECGEPGHDTPLTEPRRRAITFRTDIRTLQSRQITLCHRRARISHPRQCLDAQDLLRLRRRAA